jgi:succinate-semialdehyde dehydrogenase/glutarate-semialdehyde dehydrogenase
MPGFPAHLFATALVPSAGVKALIEDPHIAAVTLTGSVPAGRSVAAAAGAVLKKCVLELGGADAYLVLEDADVRAAAKVCAAARMVNAGQSCIAGKRFIVVREVRAAFEAAMVEAMRGYEMGDPRQPHTRLGPLVSVAARDQIHAQVEASVRAGARLLLGGRVPDRPGRGIRRRCSPTSAPASRRTTRRCSGRSPRSSRRPTSATRSRSPTPASSASARAC